MADPLKPLPADEAASKGEDTAVAFWLGEMEKALKREKSYRAEAKELNNIYEGLQDTPYNILYSNTETLAPAIYTQAPRPDSKAKAREPGPIENAAAGLIDAYLTQFIDSGDARYCSYDDSASESLIHALVPGRGLQRFHYRAEIEYDEQEAPQKVKDELVYGEALDWDKVLFGDAKTWKGVPWIAFIHDFTREMATAELGQQAASLLSYSTSKDDEEEKERGDKGHEPTARCYEVWNKAKREVFFISTGCKVWVKAPFADPYRLQNFYPMQEPLTFFRSISKFLPVPLYRLYKSQAEELNICTRRIKALTHGMKVRGAYDGSVDEFKDILKADDNILVPIENAARLGDGADLGKGIWLVPIEQHIIVLQQLIAQRQSIKMVIFEIMGIADIMRGSSAASETLGAQKIKSQWGTLRLKTAQKAMAKYVREGLRIAAELAFSKLAPETLRIITGSTLPSKEQKLQAVGALQAAQASGQPPDPAAVNLAGMPAFEECLALLKDDIHRSYTIDIETNSTIDAEATEDKESIAEFMNAMSQFLTGVAPLVETGALPFEAAQGMLIAICRRFHFGRELEEHLKKMQPPKPQGDGKAQAEAQKAQEQLMNDRMKLQKDKMSLDGERMKFKVEQAQAQAQQVISQLKAQVQDEKAKMDLERLLMEVEKAMMGMQQAHEQQSAEIDMAGQRLQIQGEQQQMAADRTSMSQQQQEAKFATKQTVASERMKQQQAKAKPTPKGAK